LLDGIKAGLSSDKSILKSVVKVMDEQRANLGRDFSDKELEIIKQSIIDAYELKVESVKKTKEKEIERKKAASSKKKNDYDDLTFEDLSD
jgi:hypothetical protein